MLFRVMSSDSFANHWQELCNSDLTQLNKLLAPNSEDTVFTNKHLITGPKGNSEFCFPETLNVPRGEAEGNIEVEGKQNSLLPEGPVIKCFVIPPNSK